MIMIVNFYLELYAQYSKASQSFYLVVPKNKESIARKLLRENSIDAEIMLF